MFNLQVSDSTLLLGVSVVLATIVLIIVGLRWYFQNVKQENEDPDWLRSKSLPFDPLKHNSAFFQIGLIAALGLTILAFNWSQKDHSKYFEAGEFIEEEFIEVIPRTQLPKPPTPPPPVTIEPIPEEDIMEEPEDFVDQTIDIDDEIIIPDIRPKKKVDKAPIPIPVIEEEKDEIFMRVHNMPIFPGCEDMDNGREREKCTEQEIFNYIFKRLKYPPIARENGVEGNVVLSFVVDKQGNMTDLKMLRDIGAGCGDSALSTLKKMKEDITFTPGREGARAVKVRYNLPIKFKLQ